MIIQQELIAIKDNKLRLNDIKDLPEVYEVPLRKIKDVSNPFTRPVWSMYPLNRKKVKNFVYQNVFDTRVNLIDYSASEAFDEEYDERRVAYLVCHPETWWPISIEVDRFGGVSIEDGYHRIAAAIIRKDLTIKLTYGGWVDKFEVFFKKKKLVGYWDYNNKCIVEVKK